MKNSSFKGKHSDDGDKASASGAQCGTYPLCDYDVLVEKDNANGSLSFSLGVGLVHEKGAGTSQNGDQHERVHTLQHPLWRHSPELLCTLAASRVPWLASATPAAALGGQHFLRGG